MNDSVVTVTGGTGYLATHVIKQLQEAGYPVRATVRNIVDQERLSYLQDLVPTAKHKLELFEADLLDPESWDAAVNGAEFVIHVASPNPASNPTDENIILKPAVEGTLNVLKARVKSKTVKRVVLTSSVAAVADFVVEAPKGRPFSEERWESNPNNAYTKSKVKAEEAAWEYIKGLPDEDKIELATINPGCVVGPILHNTHCASMEIIDRLLGKPMPAVPRLNMPYIDIRDVAAAHLRAMTIPEAAGHRHIITSKNFWATDVAVMLEKEFKSQGYKVPTRTCPYFALWLASFADPTVEWILPMIGKVYMYDNSRMKNVLKITPRDINASVIEMAYTMIEKGFIPKAKKYRGPTPPL